MPIIYHSTMHRTAAATGVGISLDNVSHDYGGVTAVDGVSLAIYPGELVVLLGPSGCGKTTLLRIVAGLLRQTSGHVTIGGETVDALPPNERGAGIVFQNYALFPHMLVEANVGYGLRARGTPSRLIRETVAKMLALVRMEPFAKRLPRELSGGQQQRVALARTLAVSPRVLLLDEPFGALDKNLRLDMQIEVKRLQRELNITTIMVTHDQEEALGMADRIAVMRGGNVEQFASPEDIYDNPKSLFVAGFVGTANLLRGHLKTRRAGVDLDLGAGGRLDLPAGTGSSGDGAAIVAVRPEHLRFGEAATSAIPARVEMVLHLGPSIVYELLLRNGAQVKLAAARSGAALPHAVGDEVWLRLAEDAPVGIFAA
jgi:putative spermidine/putrescine transport system ATP-binding protein